MSAELLKPMGLEADNKGNLFVPVYFSNYNDLTRIKTGLAQSLKLLALVQWDNRDDPTVEACFPNVFDSVTELLLQLSESDQENANLLDHLHEKHGSKM